MSKLDEIEANYHEALAGDGFEHRTFAESNILLELPKLIAIARAAKEVCDNGCYAESDCPVKPLIAALEALEKDET